MLKVPRSKLQFGLLWIEPLVLAGQIVLSLNPEP